MLKLTLEDVLRKKKMSKRQFAKRLEIHYNHVFRYFHDGYDPKLSTLSRWAKALGVKIKDLYKE